MLHTEMERLFKQGAYSELIQKLEQSIENYDEYEMRMLIQCYSITGNETAAKRLKRKYHRLYPNGEDTQETLLGAVQTRFVSVAGMESVKKSLNCFFYGSLLSKERDNQHLSGSLFRNSNVFITGNRGSGKTLLAGIVSALFYDFNVAAQQECQIMTARELEFLYRTEGRAGLEKMRRSSSNSTLLIEDFQDIISDECDIDSYLLKDLLQVLQMDCFHAPVIATGLPETWQRLNLKNPTFKDSFSLCLDIAPYSADELLQIMGKLAQNRSLKLDSSCHPVLLKQFSEFQNNPDFLNAITLQRILDKAVQSMTNRFMQNDDQLGFDKSRLLPEDFHKEKISGKTLQSLLDELDSYTGLQSVKEQVHNQMNRVLVNQKAEQMGASVVREASMHMLFVGNPGTGKTMIAKTIGQLYQALGILKHAEPVVRSRGNLVGEYQGQSAKRVREAFLEASGGVLFIDEAYSLCNGPNDNFGQETVNELTAQLDEYRDSTLVILAGYKDKIFKLLESNEGLKSRFRLVLEFQDYSITEMAEIFEFMLKRQEKRLDDSCLPFLHQALEEKSREPDFGNARGVRNFLDDVLEAQSGRLISSGNDFTLDEYQIICREDLEQAVKTHFKNEETLNDLLSELDSMIGLENAKRVIHEMIDWIQVDKAMQEKGLSGELESQRSRHLLFVGNAGTGKTTVARLLGKIYCRLGVLEKNVFVEVNRDKLVAGYQGQTAAKVRKQVGRADGGILFVDEAYALDQGERDSFGHEAVTQLLAEMENHRDTLMVILAGYETEMKHFLSGNQGFSSRISNTIVFDDYSVEELGQIFERILETRGYRLYGVPKDTLQNWIRSEMTKVQDFGNARGVRNLAEHCIARQKVRLAAMLRQNQDIETSEFLDIVLNDLEGTNEGI